MTLTLIVFLVALAFGVGAVLGAPYVPILKDSREDLLDLADLKPGQTVIDLGSGDGTFLRAAAKRGLHAIGYEINPILVAVSWIVCWPYRDKVRIHLANVWQIKIPPSNAIYVFLMGHYMPKLAKKLHAEIVKPTIVVSYVYEIPDELAIRKNRNTHVYLFGKPTN